MATAASPAANVQEAEVKPVPFEVADEAVAGEANSSEKLSRATFTVPKAAVARLLEHDLSKGGAYFKLHAGGPSEAGTDLQTIFTVFQSPRPERTAEALAIIIAKRLQDPEGADRAAQECCLM
mmetsp:Transcript_73246/g.160333  ORF Transcript_73246/g.160333 Transcript_73246/m.160333 type:complete len:123 (-) Transcript_73246:15-383(-)